MLVTYAMTIPHSVNLGCSVLVAALLVLSSLLEIVEASRYHHTEEIISKNPRHRLRHRHDAALVMNGRRKHDYRAMGRNPAWTNDDNDYEDAFATDPRYDEEEYEDYEMERSARNHQPSRGNYRSHRSRFEPRFFSRHHQGAVGSYGVDRRYRADSGAVGWNNEEDPTSRRLHHDETVAGTARTHRQRPGREGTRHDERTRPSGFGYRSRSSPPVDDSGDRSDPLDEQSAFDRGVSKRWRFDEDADDGPQGYRSTGNIIAHSSSSRRGRHRGRQDPRKPDWKSGGRIKPGSSVQRTGKRPNRLPLDDPRIDSSESFVTANEAAIRGNKRSKNNHGNGNFPISRKVVVQADDPDYHNYEEVAAGNGGQRKKFNKRRKDDDDGDNDDDDDGFDADDPAAAAVDDDNDNEAEDDENDDDEDADDDYNDDHDDDDDDDDDGGIDDEVNDGDDGGVKGKAKEEEEEEYTVWKNADEEVDDEDDLFDTTNYYKTDNEPPYKTFDDIIKSLTSDDPTTSKPTIRRDYRNIGIEKYLKRDVYGNIFDSRNGTRGGHGTSSNRWRIHESKPDTRSHPSVVKDGKKVSNAIGDLNSWKGRKEGERRRVYSNWDASLSSRTKSLEQEYDEEYEDNEKDEDAARIGRQRVSEMQADIDNTNYADEENETEIEDETLTPPVSSLPTTTTIPTTTSRSVITTRPPAGVYERKDMRSHDSWSDSQSNGLQQQSAHSIHKWQSTSNHDSSKDSKGHGLQNNVKNGKAADIKEALQHAIKVSREGSCQWPRARVIPVRDVYPSPSTTYIPHCAILHRCSDDTGCCRSEALTCVPKLSHRVELYFYTTSIGGASVVEKLSFYNHTECECKERDENTGGGVGAAVEKTSGGTNEQRFTRHHANPVSPPPQNIRRPPPQRKPCRCPSEFTPRITPEGECQCNCFENHQNCIRTRRGKGYFSLRDRLCIQNEECATPMCEFGEYMRRQGKCPKKKDRFDAIANHPTNINLHHRIRN